MYIYSIWRKIVSFSSFQNIFSAIGIYRQNKFKLRPTIYVSSKEVKEDREEYVVKCCIDEEWSYKKGQETAENPTKDEEKANLINYLKDRIREMRLSLDDMNNKLNDDNKGNAEVKKNDKPTKKNLPETQKESSVIDNAKEVPMNKMNDNNKGNAEVKKNDKPTKKSLSETKKESSANDEIKEETKELEEETEIEAKNDVKQCWIVQQFYVSLKKMMCDKNKQNSHTKTFLLFYVQSFICILLT